MVRVHLIRRLAVKRLMRSGLVVEYRIALHTLVGRTDGAIGVQIHLLVFDAFPETFHEHVVSPATFSVHADLDAVLDQQAREFLASKLAPFVGIEAPAGHSGLRRPAPPPNRNR